MIKQNKEIFYSISLIVIPVAILIVSVILTKPSDEIREIAIKEITIIEEVHESDVFENINIKARSAIVVDINTGEVLYAKNEKLPLPLASITKVLTALTTEINSSKKIFSISIFDLVTQGESLFYPGERFYKKDLIDLTLVSSSNDGASALAANTFSALNTNDFVLEMNAIARNIGMRDSYFYNVTGLDSAETVAGAHGSAEDVATLFEYVLENYPEILESTKRENISVTSIDGLIHDIHNTNQIAGMLPNLIASKTGFTEIAGGNLVVAIDPALNRPIVIVVMGSTEQGRFEDVILLSDMVIKSFE